MGDPSPRAAARCVAAHQRVHGDAPDFVVRAPGRVNLIGEHTDYNDGFVLPMAIPFDTAIAVTTAPPDERSVHVVSEGFGSAIVDLDTEPDPTTGWAAYLHGVAWVLRDLGHRTPGWRGAIATDVPTGASLSSSAALEVATTLVFARLAGIDLDPLEVASIGRRVENEVFGLPSGIMDQLASAGATEGCATLIDCRSLERSAVPLPTDVSILIIDTGTRRELVESAYQARQATCARVAAALGAAALRDATLGDLDRLALDDDEGRRRARHVITENARTLDAAEALRGGDAVAAGSLMDASHVSLRDDYEVSSPGLDLVVGLARSVPGCLGARMTGGGFAGCAVALVRTDAVDDVTRHVVHEADVAAVQPQPAPLTVYAVLPAAGAGIVAGSGPSSGTAAAT